jgi:hypothetical protein
MARRHTKGVGQCADLQKMKVANRKGYDLCLLVPAINWQTPKSNKPRELATLRTF